MKKLLVLLAIFFFIGCSEGSSDQDLSPVISSITISDDGIIYHNKPATITVVIEDHQNTVSSVEFLIDDKLCKTIRNQPYQYKETFRDYSTGDHELSIVVNCANGKKAQKSCKFTFRVNVGDEYLGGVVVALKNEGINGTIAATSDLKGGVVGRYKYGAYNGDYGAFSMDDGISNSEKFRGKPDNNYAAIACINSKLNNQTDWYLPAYNELALFEQFLEELNIPERSGWIYWSSTGDATNLQKAYAYPFGVSFGTPCDMQGQYRVRCCRQF